MKQNFKRTTGTNIAIIVVSLMLIYQNTNAQPHYIPWSQKPPQRSVVVPYPSTQNDRQGYNPYMSTGGVQPFLSFSIHFDPLISWFSTDNYDTRNDGVVPGINFGMSYNRYFSPNYSFSSGISIINAGGRLVSRDITHLELRNYNRVNIDVQPGEAITYKITYFSIPLGIKLQTNQIGYGRFFTDLGFDPKIVIGGRAYIPSLNIKGGNAMPQLNLFNLSYHIMAGMEYPLGGNNSFIVGIGFEKNLFDITRDNGDQPIDLITQKLLSFRLGITF